MLTPISKYYASEMCVRVANDALQVLGGSGYMTDYPVERYLRDARITTIYEGTSQLQIVAAVRSVCGRTFEKYVEELEATGYDDAPLNELKQKLVEARQYVADGVAFVKEQDAVYMDLCGRELVDAAAVVMIGHLLLRQAAANDRKRLVARRFIETSLGTLRRDMDRVKTGDRSVLVEFETFACPVPAAT
jgi:hypothetical protein